MAHSSFPRPYLKKTLGPYHPIPTLPSRHSSDNMAVLAADVVGAISPQIASGILTAGLLFLFFYTVVRVPGWIKKLKLWQEYCVSHSKFSLQAGQGKYKWLEDPWSSESSSPHTCPYHFTTLELPSTMGTCKENDQLTHKIHAFPSQSLATTGFAVTRLSNMSLVAPPCKSNATLLLPFLCAHVCPSSQGPVSAHEGRRASEHGHTCINMAT